MAINLKWRTLNNGVKSAYLDINHNGQRKYEFLKIRLLKNDTERKEKKRLAEAIRAKRELEITTGEYNFTPSHKKKVNFIEYFENYLNNYTKRDKRKVRYSLEKFKKFIRRDKIQFREITSLICEQFQDYLTSPESGLTGETPYDYWKRFKGVLKQAIKDGIILKNPADGLLFNGYSKHSNQLRKNILTTDELQAIAYIHCGNAEVKRAFLFACFTGLGMAEIRKLTWGRINNGKIKIFREKSGEQIINDLPPVAVKLLGVPSNPDELIFSLPSEVAVSKDLKVWVKKAGIEKNISFYCGRHTFATQLLMNGANLKTVADCMGHANTKHTIKYLNYVDALKSEAISNLPEIKI